MKKYGSIEKVLQHLDKSKYTVPDNFPYEEIREIFRNPQVQDPEQIDVGAWRVCRCCFWGAHYFVI